MRLIPIFCDKDFTPSDKKHLATLFKDKFTIVLSLENAVCAIFIDEASLVKVEPRFRHGVPCIYVDDSRPMKAKSGERPLHAFAHTPIAYLKAPLDLLYLAAQRTLDVFSRPRTSVPRPSDQ